MAKIQESGIHNGSVNEKKGKSRDCSRDQINTKRKKEGYRGGRSTTGRSYKKRKLYCIHREFEAVKFDARTKGRGRNRTNFLFHLLCSTNHPAHLLHETGLPP